MSYLRQAAPPVIQAVGWLPSPEKENKIEETLEQLRQDRDAYKQAYENMCVFYKQLVLAKQRLTASYEAVEHSVQRTANAASQQAHLARIVVIKSNWLRLNRPASNANR